MPRDPLTRLRVPETGMEWPDHDPNLHVLLRHGDLVDVAARKAVGDAAWSGFVAAVSAPEAADPAPATAGEG